ncbi:hypothetical protein HF078_12555 [Bacillus sp. RO2]|uniref:SAR2788 family putative toxin n=1 Tax=Bacillus sp. RO2 TaxID=2723913 RepID=UPI00145EBADD|nr:SAR2788 family putative toxin [Bacillus sp. RO2]NMH73915.1 hypothetical protein [Bacillus sp. RO2]
MYKKIISSFIIFTLVVSLFSGVASAQDNSLTNQPHLEENVQQELENILGEEIAENFETEVEFDNESNEHIIQIENSQKNISPLSSEVIIDENNNLEIYVEYLDDFNNEIKATYNVLPIKISEEEFVAEIVDINTGETYLLDSNEMNASVVPIIIAHIIRIGVTAAIGIVGKALIKSAVKKLAFRSQKLLDQHYDKHVIKQKEYGSITKNQYLEKAQNLIGSDSSNVLSKKRSDGSRVFYNKSTNDFSILSKDGFIQTLFKPTDKINYYNRQK